MENNESSALQIAIADDHALFRKSLRLMVQSFGNMQVVIEAANGRELLHLLPVANVDILLLDLQMPEMDGFETCKLVKSHYPSIKILALTQLDDADSIDSMLEFGVDGYFTKNTDPSELKHALLQLADGGFCFEERLSVVIDRLWQRVKNRHRGTLPIATFTTREVEIIHLTMQGSNEAMIAGQLFISRKTVEKHKRNLMEKTGAPNFIGVITYALINGLLTINDLRKLQP